VASLPRDLTDLYLSPVVLAIDERIEELGHRDVGDLAVDVAVASNRRDETRPMREEALLITVGHLVETHGWTLSWDPRGLRLTNSEHTVVLGVPPVFDSYLAGVDQGAVAGS
jgi:hypothetical protein